jgi:NADPH2:quinone reductase
LRRKNCAGPGDRRIGRQRGDATGTCPRRKARYLKHNQSCESRQAKALGFNEVIDTSLEKLGDGVRRITDGCGADIVIDGLGGDVLSEALGALAPEGSLTTLGYAAGRKTTIDVTNLIWQRASIRSFVLFTQPQAAWDDAWNVIVPVTIQSG